MGTRWRFLVLIAASTAACGGADESAPIKSAKEKPHFAIDECGLNTGYPGDEMCILPPPPGEGFQVHIGPTDYRNPEAVYLLGPGQEKTDFFAVLSGNDHDVFFFFRQFRVRPTFHHLSLVTYANLGQEMHTLGVTNDSQDFPSGGIVAPEDRGVGLPLAANSEIEVALHAINTMEEPAIAEAWVNFWYRDPNEVTEPALPWFDNGDPTFEIQPFETTTLGPYSCRVEGEGRLLWLFGHRHANNERFTVTRVRGSRRDVIYDAFYWDEPLRLEYSSLIENPAPDPEQRIEGGWSGILDLQAGDLIEWQCDVVNRQNTVLRFTDQAYLGEMCVIDAEAVGASCTTLNPKG
jgi:hypothetical protein